MKRLRLALFVPGAIALAAVYGLGVRGLHPLGSWHGAYGELLNGVAVGERNATDVVSAVNFDYRALDTMGEEFILFASVIAVAAILKKDDQEGEEEPDEPRPAPDSDAVRLLGVALVPATVIFGLYMITHGQVSPGGGFQGGVVLASAPLVVYLCAGAKTYLRIVPPAFTKLGEAAGAAGYALIGCLGVLAAKTFLENVLPLGQRGHAWSAGNIQVLNVSVGIAVAAGFAELLASFVEEIVESK